MSHASRRLLLFVIAPTSGFGLLVILLLLLAQAPQPTLPTIVATVDDEPISVQEWQRAVALDLVMSEIVGQKPPHPEETLRRLINERLVLRAAVEAGLPEIDRVQAEAWLTRFMTTWNLNETRFEQTLASAGLTRADLVDELVPRLLQAERALEELSPGGDSNAWVAEMLGDAEAVIIEDPMTHLQAIPPSGKLSP